MIEFITKINKFIKEKGIIDEDIIQDIYLYAISNKDILPNSYVVLCRRLEQYVEYIYSSLPQDTLYGLYYDLNVYYDLYDVYISIDDKLYLDSLLSQIEPRCRLILDRYFRHGQHVSDIAKSVKLSQSRVYTLIDKGIRALKMYNRYNYIREYVGDDYINDIQKRYKILQ